MLGASETGEIPTPAIVIDGPQVRRNLKRLADYARKRNVKLRPHTKTHKSTMIGRMQMDAGATGLTVAKVGEAKVMAGVCGDILMAYPAVDPLRCGELAKLARDVIVRVGIDSTQAANALAAAAKAAGSEIGILVDLDVGLHRTGVQTARDALGLAMHVKRAAGLRMDGLMFYPGHVKDESAESLAELAAVEAKLAETIAALREHGIEAGIVSGGSTPSAYQAHRMPSMTEARPGTYVYHDMNGVRGGYATLDECAARIHCTVVSNAVPGQFVIDAGSKTLTSDRCGPAPESGHGYVVEYPEARIVKLTEEHGQVDSRGCAGRTPQVGDRVTVIPNHICPCVNLQDQVWWRESEADAPRAMRVDARGMVF